jgi:hypothetical protein
MIPERIAIVLLRRGDGSLVIVKVGRIIILCQPSRLKNNLFVPTIPTIRQRPAGRSEFRPLNVESRDAECTALPVAIDNARIDLFLARRPAGARRTYLPSTAETRQGAFS